MANVLIIDDKVAICKLLARPIRKEQHHVAYTLTLREGLACEADGNFDVIFLDVNLSDWRSDWVVIGVGPS